MSDSRVDTSYLVSRGDLTADELKLLDDVLEFHGIELNHTGVSESHPGLAYACLRCGSVGVSATSENRDKFIEQFDPTCCGLTVFWHSANRVLVDFNTISFIDVTICLN